MGPHLLQAKNRFYDLYRRVDRVRLAPAKFSCLLSLFVPGPFRLNRSDGITPQGGERDNETNVSPILWYRFERPPRRIDPCCTQPPRAEGNTLSWYAESLNRFEKNERNPFSEGIPVLFLAGGGFPNRRRAKRPSCISVRIGGAFTRIAYKRSQNSTPAHEAGGLTTRNFSK